MGLVCSLAMATLGLGLPTSASAQGLSPAVVAELDAALAAVTTPPKFNPPGPVIDPAPLKDKLIFTIPVSTTIPFCSVVDQQMATFAGRLGLQFQAWQSNAQLAQWAQGFTAAQERGAALVNVACGLDPATVAPQVGQTLAAHIPVVAGHTYAPGQPQLAGLSGIVYGAYIPAALLEVDWIVRQTNGKANVLVITSPGTANSPFIQKAMEAQFAKYCPGCKVRYLGVNTPDWATKIAPQVQSAILADPDLNYILPIYDGMVQFTVPSIVATSATDRVKVASFNATPAVLDMIRTGNVVTFDIGEDTTWLAGAIIDQDMRVLLGKPLIENYAAGLRAFTKANVEEAGVPAKFATGYGTSAADGYAALWGLH
jgi:ribose transport system substrate-binding protein